LQKVNGSAVRQSLDHLDVKIYDGDSFCEGADIGHGMERQKWRS
jgi:hypothetical protein